eukprot:GHVP01041993.1.p1 GENE.GHVP01041993.1~~GHVP01041993.1.p1  ORF type:complete len:291 (-),score=33.92 GHVP01041993.1:161-1033(-)
MSEVTTIINIPEYNEMLDGDREDPISVTSFNILLQEYIQSSKIFIIARVESIDHRGCIFVSYYDAHSINKVIFRIDRNTMFIYRINARNPSDNLPINGKIIYYCIDKIVGGDMEESTDKDATIRDEKEDKIRDATIKDEKEDKIRDDTIRDEKEDKIRDETDGHLTKNIRVNAIYYSTDGDYLTQQTVRAFFRKNSLSEYDNKILDLEKDNNDLNMNRLPRRSRIETIRLVLKKNIVYVVLFIIYTLFGTFLIFFSKKADTIFILYCVLIILLVVILAAISARRTVVIDV